MHFVGAGIGAGLSVVWIDVARKINRLTARQVAALNRPGRHSDGGGLYLAISQNISVARRRWVLLFRWQGKLREMGLGSAATVPLAQARELAGKWRAELVAGRNPLDVREAERRAMQNGRTFGEIAAELYAAKSPGWRNPKVRKQWMTPLERYAHRLMSMPVDQIRTEDVLACLQPIWTTKSETASRVRGRIEAVIDAARHEDSSRQMKPIQRAGGGTFRTYCLSARSYCAVISQPCPIAMFLNSSPHLGLGAVWPRSPSNLRS